VLLIVEDEPGIAEELVREVLDMASGVFLWIKHPAKDAEAVRELSEEITSILIHKGAREIDGEEGM
jgi:hypothetical protein